MYKLAVFDIDGTLTVKGNEIPESTLMAIEKMKENGIECLIATGRERENIILFAKDGGRHFKPLEKNYELGPWGNGMFDLLKIGRSKAIGIEEIAGRIGIGKQRIISFGDGLNDLEMTKYAGLGVAMGNAKAELKKVANHITDTASNDGIYKACKKFGLI